MARPPIDAALLPELLEYDPETGVLTWKERGPEWFKSETSARTWNARFAGRRALSSRDSRGYEAGKMLGRSVRAHRVCWALHTGEWPSDEIDHINGVGYDNRFANLREATRAENNQNLSSFSNSTSRYPGVHWDRNRCKWRAKIFSRGRDITIGRFETEEEAFAAYCAAKRKLHTFNPVPREVQNGLV